MRPDQCGNRPLNARVSFCLLVLIVTAGMHSGCGQGAETSITKDEKAVAEDKNTISEDKNGRPASMEVSEEAALVIARKASAGIKMPRDCPVDTELVEGKYIITFRIEKKKKSIPEPGPDYYSRIIIDAKTGSVIQKLTF